MLRIKTSALTIKENKAYYQYKLFTGIAFSVVDGVVERALNYKDGMTVDVYHSPYIPEAENEICIDEAMLKGEKYEDEPPFLYQGQRFSGIVYSFDGEFCVGEYQVSNGIMMAEIYILPNNQLEYLRLSYNGIFQAFTWYENGLFEEIELFEKESGCRLNIALNENEEIKRFGATDNYFDRLSAFQDRLRFNFIKSRNFSKHLNLASELSLSGSGINDTFFAELKKCQGFSGINTIKFFQTSLSIDVIMALSKNTNLTKICVNNDKRFDIPPMLAQLKRQRPDLLVEADYVEIT